MNRRSLPAKLPRYVMRAPMPEEEQQARYKRITAEHGVRVAAARAAGRGVVLMVRSLEHPHYAVPYPEFAQQVVERRQQNEGVPMAATEEHNLGYTALSQEAELERVPS